MDSFSNLISAAHNEVATLAGIVNLVALLGFIRAAPAVGLVDRMSEMVIRLVEGSRKYRAARHGFVYRPMPATRTERPESWSPLKNAIALILFAVVCSAVIVAAKRASG